MRKGEVERGEEKMKSKKKTDRRENTVTSLEGFFLHESSLEGFFLHE